MMIKQIALALTLSLSFAGSALAEDLKGAQVSLHAGYGITTGDGMNPFGLGFGVRGGLTLDSNLYVGGVLSYWLGDSEGDSDSSSTGVNTMFIGGEVGYDLGLGPIVLRPELGIGVAIGSTEVCILGSCNSNSNSEFAIAPGVSALYPMDGLFLGAEVRANIIFADGADAGMHFGLIGGYEF